ncbi:MAG: triose-phosphate isomerase [Gammaproteobacteria bacterium]|nr:triose-phosphate isomerase [Gammaproteobacteria bacterium]
MRRRWVMGNWKMHGSLTRVRSLLDDIKHADVTLPEHCGSVVFPPAVYLELVQGLLSHTPIAWGAQNVYPANEGAFTGEISGPMLKELGCRFVLVGHSERRHLLAESDQFVAKKCVHVKTCGMTPVFCIGETLEERQAGLTQSVLLRQLNALRELDEKGFHDLVIAYEPVWAIGTGQAATPTQVQEVHQFIRQYLSQIDGALAAQTSILYGGSVTPDNAAELFALPDVDGGLVGGASLDASRWKGILQCIN